MTKSQDIRDLAAKGLAVADIARGVGVRYQFAYNVLSKAGLLSSERSNIALRTSAPTSSRVAKPVASSKPRLSADQLRRSGFEHVSRWVMSGDALVLEAKLPSPRGVYAFVIDGCAVYVGLATMGIARRLYFYGRPGRTQTTSIRIGEKLKAQLAQGASIEIYVAHPPDLIWNELPVSGDAGLELGLIQTFQLPWNIRGA